MFLKRTLAVLLSATMLFGMTSLSTTAATTDTEAVSAGNYYNASYLENYASNAYNEQKEADKAAKQLERVEKVAHMKEVKHQVKENAQKQAENMDAYVVLSFDTYEAKAAFCERFGYEPDMKFIKGEVFDEQVERID